MGLGIWHLGFWVCSTRIFTSGFGGQTSYVMTVYVLQDVWALRLEVWGGVVGRIQSYL